MEWAVDQKSFSLISLDGKFLGNFDGLVATDKLLASPGFTYITGQPPPLGKYVGWFLLIFGAKGLVLLLHY